MKQNRGKISKQKKSEVKKVEQGWNGNMEDKLLRSIKQKRRFHCGRRARTEYSCASSPYSLPRI